MDGIGNIVVEGVAIDPGPWDFVVPPAIRFGAGRVAEVGEAAALLGKRVWLVGGRRSLASAPHRDAVEASLARAGLAAEIVAVTAGEPTVDDVAAALATLPPGDRDGVVVVAVGGGSAILAGDRLIYVADCATAAFVVALDQGTGKIRWRVPRTLPPKMKFSFGSPLPIEVGGQLQIVVPGAGAVTALDPRDGRELWRVRYSRENAAAPRPVFAHGLVFVAAGYLRAELLAIRPDGAGDVTDTHVAWRLTKGAPIVPALLAVGDELYGVNDAGVATCWEAKTGRVHWQERLDGNYSAAPLVAGGRIYFQNETGLGTVVEAKPVFAKLAVNDLGERTIAAAAAADGSLFVRTEKNLYRIASPAPAPSSGSADRSTARPNAFEPVLGRGWRQENARLSAP